MLDNVIDINTIPVLQGKYTNERYRPVGLGTFGFAHLLAQEGIYWESDESVTFTDKVYEEIAYETIKASMELSVEKGQYDYFEGSDWATGEYFTERGYSKETSVNELDWEGLSELVKVNGVRNG